VSVKKKLFLVIASVVFLGISITGPLDQLSDDYTDEAMANATVTFAIARVMNGVVSVIQGTRLSATPAGVGVDVAAGEILDPLNDLLEQFSWLMLAAITSLGIQKILLSIGPSIGFNLLLSLSILYLVISLWKKNQFLRPSAGIKMVMGIIILRFGIALVVLSNQLVFQAFMENDYQVSTSSLQKISADLERLDLGATEESETKGSLSQQSSADTGDGSNMDAEADGWLAAIRRFYSDTVDIMNPTNRIDEIQAITATVMGHLFKLLAIFVLQTILIPLAFLWAIYQAFRWIINYDFMAIHF
jgi:hypothetical protein